MTSKNVTTREPIDTSDTTWKNEFDAKMVVLEFSFLAWLVSIPGLTPLLQKLLVVLESWT